MQGEAEAEILARAAKIGLPEGGAQHVAIPPDIGMTQIIIGICGGERVESAARVGGGKGDGGIDLVHLLGRFLYAPSEARVVGASTKRASNRSAIARMVLSQRLWSWVPA